MSAVEDDKSALPREIAKESSKSEAQASDKHSTQDEMPDDKASEIAAGEASREPDVYDTFSKSRKRTILAIASYNCFISRKLSFLKYATTYSPLNPHAPLNYTIGKTNHSAVTASIILPSIPDVAVDLNTTASIINVTGQSFFPSLPGPLVEWG